MFKTAGYAVLYTVMNVRYAALIIPTAVIAYLLQIYILALVAAGLLVLAAAAEVALSIANGVSAAMQIREHDQLMNTYMADVEKHANDWTHRGSEDPAREGEGEDPSGEGQDPVPAR